MIVDVNGEPRVVYGDLLLEPIIKDRTMKWVIYEDDFVNLERYVFGKVDGMYKLLDKIPIELCNAFDERMRKVDGDNL